MSQSENQARESALDRLGPAIVWIGLVIVVVLATGVMVEGQARFNASYVHPAAASGGGSH